ncbi:mesothelin [Candoia aspera]|uniref:mesothelin n=1 Tax=Candoia aspera TaxID=51853 RepID=UPI002FD876C7
MPESPSILCCLFMVGCAIMFIPSYAVKFLNISGPVIGKNDTRISGHLVCKVSGDYIAASGENLLKRLSQCQHLPPVQTKAIQAIFSSGNTSFGRPSASSVPDEFSQSILIVNFNILQAIPKSVLVPWLQTSFLHSDLPQDQLVQTEERLKSPRQKREAAKCPEEKVITKEVLNDVLNLLSYSAEDLKLCLTEEFLRNHLDELLQIPFTSEQLMAIMGNLDKIFPTGYPPSAIGILGDLIDESNIKKWTIDSPSTLRALLDSVSDDELRTLAIRRYIDLGNQIDSPFLNILGSYICLLNEDQLSMISEESIEMATTLDPSSCSQAIKDNLYPKAKRAFSDRHYYYREYYKRIKLFLGGAPGVDLRALSKNDINMDINTFLGLKSSSLKELTPENVKGLLGTNLNSLTDYQNVSPTKEWIQSQKQSDLDSLGLGLRGGLPEGYIILTKP